MKKEISILKMTMTICAMMLLSGYSVSAQTMISKTVISPLQAGTVTISQGHAYVDLAKEVTDELINKENQPAYYVVFTPQASVNVNVVMTDKNDKGFSIKATARKMDANGSKIDYVVFVKETVTMPDPLTIGQIKHKGISTK